MDRRLVLDDKLIRSLQPSDKRFDVLDAIVPGLLVTVSPSGTKSMVLRTRKGAKSPIRRAIGIYGRVTLEQARRTAREWLELLDKGGDPKLLLERQRDEQHRLREEAAAKTAATFGVVYERFCERKLSRQRRGDNVKQALKGRVLEDWRNLPVANITHKDVRTALQKLVDREKYAYAHNLFDACRAFFAFCIDEDLIEVSPVARLKRNNIIGERKHRERWLNDDEIFALWRATDHLAFIDPNAKEPQASFSPYGPLYKLMLLTGARLSELTGARWAEFDLERGIWKIPPERYKVGQTHLVPLTADMLTVLKKVPRYRSGDLVFSTTFGKSPLNGFSKIKKRIDRRMLRTLRALARLRKGDPAEVKLEPFINHDVRRSVRTGLSKLRVQDHIAEAVIGHGRKGIARVYDMHRFDDEKREALELWNAKLRAPVNPPPSNVVPLRAESA
jgi:integrase